MESIPKKEQRLTAMFSATFPKQVRAMSTDYLARYAYLKIGLPINGTTHIWREEGEGMCCS